MVEPKRNNLEIKINLIGNSEVGKSSILSRYAANRFSYEASTTTGMAHISKTEIIAGEEVKIVLWDTAG